mmetsp:Transcript_7663/g.31115  ORF Transcript_7663/g.31115 Transcript_7663/m.31115 type:complete len:224 (-) Transcript_7663:2607-3278(-)
MRPSLSTAGEPRTATSHAANPSPLRTLSSVSLSQSLAKQTGDSDELASMASTSAARAFATALCNVAMQARRADNATVGAPARANAPSHAAAAHKSAAAACESPMKPRGSEAAHSKIALANAHASPGATSRSLVERSASSTRPMSSLSVRTETVSAESVPAALSALAAPLSSLRMCLESFARAFPQVPSSTSSSAKHALASAMVTKCRARATLRPGTSNICGGH